MSNQNKKFYITTAIPYVNAPPHIGHALEFIQTDVLARHHRLLGENVFFLTGTDENSLSNVKAAEEEKIPVRELVERNAEEYRNLTKILNISNNDFIRTTQERHIKGAQKLWEACKKDIFKKHYKGLYCISCETFYTEKDLVNDLCPEHKTKPEQVEEENYFFRLSNYEKDLKNLIEKNELKIVPESRRNEVLSFINQGLEDFSISRSRERAKNWGIPVPGDDNQIEYVWFDALSNYINALGYAEGGGNFKKYWQKNEDILHVIGKGIIRFHAVYWPAMLLSAGLSLPRTIFVHGYLTVEGEKMSKTIGNVISPKELVEKYGIDPVRYYLLREIPSAEDGDFSYEKFEDRYNSDLANGIGNLVARVLTLVVKTNQKFQILNSKQIQNSQPEADPPLAEKSQTTIKETWDKYNKSLEEFKFNEALEAVWQLIGFCNEYINKERPWEEKESSKAVISHLLFALANIAWLLRPFLPETSDKIFSQLGLDPQSKDEWQKQEFKIEKGESLFPRLK